MAAVGYEASIVIAPGQILSLPLELRSESDGQYQSVTAVYSPHCSNVDFLNVHKYFPPSDHQLEVPSAPIFLPCRKGFGFHVLINPSRGSQVKVPIEMTCRNQNQSFLFSFLGGPVFSFHSTIFVSPPLPRPCADWNSCGPDHDKSVAQAAVLFPLTEAPEDTLYKARQAKHGQSKAPDRPSAVTNTCKNFKTEGGKSVCVDGDATAAGAANVQVPEAQLQYPVLLTLHGTGLAAMSQADAYKMMPSGAGEYVFGVQGFWVVAPTRHGAHNWEVLTIDSVAATCPSVTGKCL